jgi:hypothetical protein
MTRLGIDVDQYLLLKSLDPDAHTWTDGLKPALDNVFEITALDESCAHWVASHYAISPRVIIDGELVTYTTILHTSPARPEWLVDLDSRQEVPA